MIEVQDLCRRIGTRDIIRNVTVLFCNGGETGNVYALLGSAGAGKTTLMELIAGCIRPDAGKILIGGYDTVRQARDAKRQIGYMPQRMQLPGDMTVWEYLTFIADAKKLSGERAILRISGVCEQVGISDVRDRRMAELTVSVRRRVALAQALLNDPEYLLLDDPAGGLDPSQAAVLYRLIRSVSAGRTVLIAERPGRGVREYCDRIVMLNQGSVVAEDEAEKLCSAAMPAENVLCLTAKGDAEEITELLRGIEGVRDVTVVEKHVGQVSLTLRLSAKNPDAENGQTPDVRDEIFFSMAEKRYALLSMEMRKQSPENICDDLTKEDRA